MDAIMDVIGKIDFEQIIDIVKKVVAWVQESGIIEKVVDVVKGLIANIA